MGGPGGKFNSSLLSSSLPFLSCQFVISGHLNFPSPHPYSFLLWKSLGRFWTDLYCALSTEIQHNSSWTHALPLRPDETVEIFLITVSIISYHTWANRFHNQWQEPCSATVLLTLPLVGISDKGGTNMTLRRILNKSKGRAEEQRYHFTWAFLLNRRNQRLNQAWWAHAYNPSILGDWVRSVKGHPWLPINFKVRLSWMKPYQNSNNNNKKNANTGGSLWPGWMVPTVLKSRVHCAELRALGTEPIVWSYGKGAESMSLWVFRELKIPESFNIVEGA